MPTANEQKQQQQNNNKNNNNNYSNRATEQRSSINNHNNNNTIHKMRLQFLEAEHFLKLLIHWLTLTTASICGMQYGLTDATTLSMQQQQQQQQQQLQIQQLQQRQQQQRLQQQQQTHHQHHLYHHSGTTTTTIEPMYTATTNVLSSTPTTTAAAAATTPATIFNTKNQFHLNRDNEENNDNDDGVIVGDGSGASDNNNARIAVDDLPLGVMEMAAVVDADVTTAFRQSNDSNEIDSGHYVMAKHIASHAIIASSTIDFNKTRDLSSLSLLSFNDTSAAAAVASSSSASLQQQQQQQQQQPPPSSLLSLSSTSAGTAMALAMGVKSVSKTQTPSSSSALRSGSGMDAPHHPNTANTSLSVSPSMATAKVSVKSSAKKVETKYVLPKPQKTDAPMLNYIFDTFSANKHHHHDQRYGPHFEDVQRIGQPTNITVQAGSSIHLNCRISLLQDKTVSWVRRNIQSDENALDLLTVGLHTYTGDQRYKMEFQYPNNWRLKITNVKKDDEAMYECQISTHPPRVIQINLHVNAPKVMIVDEFGDPLQEKYYEIDSTLQLSCMVRNVAMSSSVVYWKHGDAVLNYDVTRGGVSVKTELMEDGANSTLSIAKIKRADSGNYTCSISDYQNFTIVVHILNGESFAELHHGSCGRFSQALSLLYVALALQVCVAFLRSTCRTANIPR